MTLRLGRHRQAGLRRRRIAIAAVGAVILSACSTPVPPQPAPAAPLASQFSNNPAPGSAAAQTEAAWWALHGDATLVQLVAAAQESNLDVAAAVQRVRQARAGADAQASRLMPSVNLQGLVSQTASGLPEAVKQRVPDTQALRLGLDVAWEVDLWGGLRAGRDAARADAAASAAALAGARLLVSSEVASHYFTLRSAVERARLLEALVGSLRQTAQLTDARVREGQASALDADRAHAEVARMAAQLPALGALAGHAQTSLAVLLGRDPSVAVVDTASAFAWPQAPDVAPGQPADLLRRRPDLIAAEARASAEGLRAQEMQTQWWPKLYLSALVGRQDLRLNGVDFAPVRFSNVALALAAPVFNAGRIDAAIESQNARSQEALLGWQKAILVAVQDVEDSLLLRAQEANRVAELNRAVQSVTRVMARADALLKEGQIDRLTWLELQRSQLGNQLALAEGRLQLALTSTQIFKALGGATAPPARAAETHQLAARTPR